MRITGRARRTATACPARAAKVGARPPVRFSACLARVLDWPRSPCPQSRRARQDRCGVSAEETRRYSASCGSRRTRWDWILAAISPMAYRPSLVVKVENIRDGFRLRFLATKLIKISCHPRHSDNPLNYLRYRFGGARVPHACRLGKQKFAYKISNAYQMDGGCRQLVAGNDPERAGRLAAIQAQAGPADRPDGAIQASTCAPRPRFKPLPKKSSNPAKSKAKSLTAYLTRPGAASTSVHSPRARYDPWAAAGFGGGPGSLR